MSDQTTIFLCALATLAGLAAYVLLAGADFGGGVWDLFAMGSRSRQQRDAIAHAMGPVWEANHVWLIFVIVMLFTCFPRGYSVLAEALFVPFHLALIGIMLRGAAFIFRNQHPFRAGIWQPIFGAASIISPFLLGAAFGSVTSGALHAPAAVHSADATHFVPWLSPYSIGCGLLALSTCAYLAAVYLVRETNGELRKDFHRRAIFAGTTTAALAIIVLFLAWREANWFFHALVRWDAWPVLSAGLLFFAASAWAVFTHRYRIAPYLAAGEIVLLLMGWGLAHWPYLIYPDMTLSASAAPTATLRFMLASLPIGAALLAPSMWLLFRVFKRVEI